MWVTNTNGKKDAMLTFATFSFTVVTLNMFLSTFDTITVGGVSVVFKSLDSSVMAIYLGSTFTAYVSRRWTDRKYHREEAAATPISAPVESAPSDVNPQGDVALSQIEVDSSVIDPEYSSVSKKRKSKRDTV